MRFEHTPNGPRRIRSAQYEADRREENLEQRRERALRTSSVWPAISIPPRGSLDANHRRDLVATVRMALATGAGKHKVARRLGVSWRTVVGIGRAA